MADSPAGADSASPAEGVNSASGPTGKTGSGESVSDSEPEGKARKAEGRRQKTEDRSQESVDIGFAALKSFRPYSAGTARLRCDGCSPLRGLDLAHVRELREMEEGMNQA
jgi:hypothetical protein